MHRSRTFPSAYNDSSLSLYPSSLIPTLFFVLVGVSLLLRFGRQWRSILLRSSRRSRMEAMGARTTSGAAATSPCSGRRRSAPRSSRWGSAGSRSPATPTPPRSPTSSKVWRSPSDSIFDLGLRFEFGESSRCPVLSSSVSIVWFRDEIDWIRALV